MAANYNFRDDLTGHLPNNPKLVERICSLAEFNTKRLAGAFVWSTTEEGYKFWDAVVRHLRNHRNPLPALPTHLREPTQHHELS